ncbi:MAG: hypothetical protein OXC40_02980 [Proteobacteria bacterium]|nr:hypothetical protein [Pseudomonadota bacterium]
MKPLRHRITHVNRIFGKGFGWPLFYLLGVFLVLGAFLVMSFRVHVTLVGYNIGHLKDQETKLLEQRSELKMTLAQMTTQAALKKNLAKDQEPAEEAPLP